MVWGVSLSYLEIFCLEEHTYSLSFVWLLQMFVVFKTEEKKAKIHFLLGPLTQDEVDHTN